MFAAQADVALNLGRDVIAEMLFRGKINCSVCLYPMSKSGLRPTEEREGKNCLGKIKRKRKERKKEGREEGREGWKGTS